MSVMGEMDPGRAKGWGATAAVTGASSVLIVALATLAGLASTALYDGWSGAMQPGAHPAGEIETLTAQRLSAYFGAFQGAAVLLTVIFAQVVRRRLAGPVLPLVWPRGGTFGIVLAAIALIAMAMTAGLIVYHFDKTALASDLRPFAEIARSRAWWVLLLAAGVGAPLAEELLFRGLLFSGLRGSPLGFAGTALVTAMFWTSLHMTYSPYGLAMLLVIGLYFAWLRERSGSLWPSIVAHGVYNGLIVMALSFTPEQALPGG